MQNVNKELEKVLALIQQEKEEDLNQYRHKMASTSLNARRKEGVCWYPVLKEKSLYNAGERLLIKVSRHKEHNESHLFQSGKLVAVFSNAGKNDESKHTVNGVVNTVKKDEMLITLNCDEEPEWMDDGNIGVQLMFDENAYFEMERAMKIVLNPVDDRLEYLKNIILGHADAEFTETYDYELPQLNTSQNKAIQLIQTAKDVAIVHGPPGTGKTTTLVEGIIQTLKKENQTLVCAPSNAAVDLLCEKLHAKGLNVVRIGHPARVTEEILNLTIDSKIANHTNYKDLKAVKKQADEYHRTALKYKRNFGHEERQQRRLLLQESSKLKKEAEQLEYYISNDILNNAQVIACTMVGASNYQIRDRKFSTVFIDEAAQGLEPATWIPITKANRVVFAGDHCQLPPTIKSQKAAKEGLEETLFEKAIKRNSADAMLDEQYRMNQDIMNFSSKVFYKNKLKANVNVQSWKLYAEDNAVEFIDTAGCGFYEQTESETKSTYNKEEADMLLKHFRQYFSVLSSIIPHEEVTVGVVSPYKAQVNLLNNQFQGVTDDYPEMTINLSVNTIDSFQGQERDIIYISLVRSNDKGIIGFLSDVRRMNVAITRAKKKLIIIGDSATIGQHPFYNEFLDYVNEINAYKSAFEFMSYD